MKHHLGSFVLTLLALPAIWVWWLGWMQLPTEHPTWVPAVMVVATVLWSGLFACWWFNTVPPKGGRS